MNDPLPQLPPRPTDGHKGTFGTVGVLGGRSDGPRVMVGGPAFSALAALRSGAGLAVLAMPEPVLNTGLTLAPSATGLCLPVDEEGRLRPSDVAELLDSHLMSFGCLAVGPGLGAEIEQQQVVVRLVAQEEVPLVLDADALNALAALHDFRGDFRAQAVLTPHVGEFRRLGDSLNIQADPLDPTQREAAARELAQRLGCVVVLKGAATVISDGVVCHRNESGNVALATAGTGDVLTGIIAGLISQFFKPHLGGGSRQITPGQQGGLSLFECARLGVYIHGRAADLWAGDNGMAGMLASDLLDRLPVAFAALRDRQAS